MTRWAIGINRFLLVSAAFLLPNVIGGCGNPHTGISYIRGDQTSGMHLGLLHEAAEYAGGSGVVVRGGKLVYQWGDPARLYDLKSTTKSIGSAALGLAIQDGLIKLEDRVIDHYPDLSENAAGARTVDWVKEITFFHLATHTAGFEKPGGYVPMLFRPGTKWAYSDSGPNWVADCLTYLYRRDLKDLLFERVFTPLGISSSDLKWRENLYRERELQGILRREFGSGVAANVKVMARFGELYLNGGSWEGKQILPIKFVGMVGRTPYFLKELTVENDLSLEFSEANKHYGILWWNNNDRKIENVPEDAFWSWGLHDSIILVIPSLDLVVARAGETIKGERSPSKYKMIEPFFEKIVKSINYGAPYPNSRLSANLIWDDSSNIIRKAEGSDTWPVTWADDDLLYTAFADGWGFGPVSSEKLSLGIAKVKGLPPAFEGTNINSNAEQYGDGKRGKKTSGMLMVDGDLYMWVRNANHDGKHSQLAWSRDYGTTWSWEPWSFEEFGYCTFINFGKNYENGRDDFVYIVSHDDPSAYEVADRFVLMRTRKGAIKDRGVYEFFQKIDPSGSPVWTHDIKKRGAVFEHKRNCFRSGITYNAGLKRYVWWQAKFPEGAERSASMFHRRDTDPRYVGAFGVFEAVEPWGPWRTLFYTEDWDVGAGETGSFPTKWMSEDGKIMHLVFSGNDYFSIRKATIVVLPYAVFQ